MEKGIEPKVWVAPAHSFDSNTMLALKSESNIRVISDGLAFAPFNQEGFLWIPQQLWNLKSMSSGLWTVCLHPNMMTDESLMRFSKDIEQFRAQITNLDSVLNDRRFQGRKRSVGELIFEKVFFIKRAIRGIHAGNRKT